jgi:hypothetical protein
MVGSADPLFGEAQLHGFFEVGEGWARAENGTESKGKSWREWK